VFTSEDFMSVTACVTGAWQAGAAGDWSGSAGTLEWSCAETADHCYDATLAPAFFLASRRQDSYPPWGGGLFTIGADKRPEYLIEALWTAARVVVGVVDTAAPDTTAVIFRRPTPMARPAADFLPRCAMELVLHGHDVAQGLGVAMEPPAEAIQRFIEHTADFPVWSYPGWSPVMATGDPWGDLLVATGRSR